MDEGDLTFYNVEKHIIMLRKIHDNANHLLLSQKSLHRQRKSLKRHYSSIGLGGRSVGVLQARISKDGVQKDSR